MQDETFGTLFRNLRKDSGHTIPEVATALGVSTGFVSNMERGKSPPLGRAQWEIAAQMFGLTKEQRERNWLLAEDEHSEVRSAVALSKKLKERYATMPTSIRRVLRILIETDY